MSYTYSPGQGISALLPNEPLGTEPFSVLAPAIRQIKAYLNDTSVGPEAKLVAVAAALVTMQAQMTSSSSMPIGTIAFFGALADFSNNGWMLCDGAELSRVTYKKLYDVIGIAYGAGNNLNTFNLPNTQGRALAGQDSGANRLRKNPVATSDWVVLGDLVGTEFVSLTEDHIPPHVHEPVAGSEPEWPYVLATKSGVSGYYSGNRGVKLQDATPSHGGGLPHNNLQPSLCLPCYIKYQ